MIVYEATKESFSQDIELIDDIIDERFFNVMGYHTSPSEKNSWKESLKYMYYVLIDSNIPNNIGIAVEYKIPNTSKRIDFIITGLDGERKNSAVIVELKQWEEAKIVSGKDAVVEAFTGHALREVAHPSYQAWSYATTIEDYNESVQERQIELHPCAYLHNYRRIIPPTLLSEIYQEYLDKAPAFVKGDAEKLREFISKYIKYGDDRETLYMIDNGKIKPSKSLQDALSNMLKGNREFIMIDEQKIVYETALKMARDSYKDGKKRTLIVKGGPGTGKSVVAINLLVDTTAENMNSFYVTKNMAPRNVYAAKLTGVLTKTRYNNLFKSSGSFFEEEKNKLDVLIVDEAHRLTKNADRYKSFRENHIREIINASRFNIFFIDESQRIHINDAGSIDEIKKYANDFNSEITIMELESQFRCNGSDGYVAWVDDVLQIRETANNDGFDLDYDIQIIDNPNDLKKRIFEINKVNNKARLLAGYCWNWKTKSNPKSNECDIVIPEYDFNMKWNLNNTTTWAIDSDSVNEVGCIHTSQGLEFDYVGVIIGGDLRYKDGKIITDFTKRASTDKSLFGIKKLYRENSQKALKLADEIIKNTYRTLITRGQKGCYIFCIDKELANYLKMRINKKR